MPGASWNWPLGLLCRAEYSISKVPVIVVHHAEDASAALAGAVVADDSAFDDQLVGVAVGIDGAAAPAAWRAAVRRVLPPAGRRVTGQQAVDHDEVGVQAAHRTTIGALVADEGVVGEVDRSAHIHAVRADSPAAEVRTVLIAAVADERGVDHLELTALIEDGAAAVVRGAGLMNAGVAVSEPHILHDELWPGLLPAVTAGPHVQDPDPAAAAQRDLAAAVNDDPLTGHDFRGGQHGDRDWLRPAVEGDDAAHGHRTDHGGRGTTGGRAVPDDVIRVRGADRPARSGDVGVTIRIAVPGQRPAGRGS